MPVSRMALLVILLAVCAFLSREASSQVVVEHLGARDPALGAPSIDVPQEAAPQPALKATVKSVVKIWDKAPHNAFTDLVRWRDRFYCAFREGKGHAGDIGVVRVIASDDGAAWESVVALAMDGLDMRDADLSITPDGRLQVLGGMQQTRDGTRATGSFVSFSDDGEKFSDPQVAVDLGRWLWRITWLDGIAYGVTYPTPDGAPFTSLVTSSDGVKFETLVPELFGIGRPTEAVVRFAPNREAYCLHRRDGTPATALLGHSRPPYREWEWIDLGVRLGGPNFIQLPGGEWVVAGRRYEHPVRTELHHLDVHTGALTPLVTLPSGGDTSYPGLVWHDGELWMSYYASHEGRTSIYLARIALTATKDSGGGGRSHRQ